MCWQPLGLASGQFLTIWPLIGLVGFAIDTLTFGLPSIHQVLKMDKEFNWRVKLSLWVSKQIPVDLKLR